MYGRVNAQLIAGSSDDKGLDVISFNVFCRREKKCVVAPSLSTNHVYLFLTISPHPHHPLQSRRVPASRLHASYVIGRSSLSFFFFSSPVFTYVARIDLRRRCGGNGSTLSASA